MGSFSSTVSALNAVSPFLGSASQFVNAGLGLANSLGRASNTDLQRQQQFELDQLAQQQATEVAIAEQNAALERQKIETQATADENRRRNALRRAAARQRAQFGSSGIGANPGGSGEAVLLGLFDQSEEEKNEAQALDQLRFAALDQDIANKKTLNLLQTQQLKANQDFERALF